MNGGEAPGGHDEAGRPALLPVKGVGLLTLLLMHSKTLIPDAPDQTKETGVGGPTLWPFFYAM